MGLPSQSKTPNNRPLVCLDLSIFFPNKRNNRRLINVILFESQKRSNLRVPSHSLGLRSENYTSV